MFRHPRPIASAKGAAVLYPKALLESLGWFDEDYFLLYEDFDLAFRARHAGAEILFVPQSRVYHKSSASMGGRKSVSSFHYSERNLQLVLLKNFPARALIRYLPGFLMVKAFRVYFTLRAGCFGAYLRGNLASIRLIPSALAKRREILGTSRISAAKFGSLLRKNFFSERSAFRRGVYDVPV